MYICMHGMVLKMQFNFTTYIVSWKWLYTLYDSFSIHFSLLIFFHTYVGLSSKVLLCFAYGSNSKTILSAKTSSEVREDWWIINGCEWMEAYENFLITFCFKLNNDLQKINFLLCIIEHVWTGLEIRCSIKSWKWILSGKLNEAYSMHEWCVLECWLIEFYGRYDSFEIP
jgi:hypothetical protein